MNFSQSTWRTLAAAVPALVLGFSAFARAEEGWMTNYEDAKKAAAKDNKDLLLDFTGSDWCQPCMMLKKEVMEKDAFKQEAPKHFVLVEVDFPQQKEQPKELKTQNEKLGELFAIKGFPTVVLADASGRAYARTGYQPGGAEAYNKHLDELRKAHAARDAGFKKAEGASGLDKAKAILEGLSAMEADVVEDYYKEEVEQVIALDSADTLGLKAKKEYLERRGKLDEQLEEFAQNQKTKEFAAAIDDFIAKEKVTGENLQDLMLTKLQVFGPADLDKADALLDEVIKVDEKTELAERARSIKARVVEMRQQVEKSKKDPAAADDAGAKEKEAPADKGDKKDQ